MHPSSNLKINFSQRALFEMAQLGDITAARDNSFSIITTTFSCAFQVIC
jgi:uncharacterized protein YjhX (UPF0386 family)